MFRVLSIDWDFFFPIPYKDNHGHYDWGCQEQMPFMINEIWNIRAANFLADKESLPQTTGEEDKFWDIFTFNEDCKLYLADSHVEIFNESIRDKQFIDSIWNFDAHHDAFHDIKYILQRELVTCEDWATAYHEIGTDIIWVYPNWFWDRQSKIAFDMMRFVYAKDIQHILKSFGMVFICRSGAWTPSWIEDRFWKFVDNCPIKNPTLLDKISRRTFDLKAAEQIANSIKIIKEKL